VAALLMWDHRETELGIRPNKYLRPGVTLLRRTETGKADSRFFKSTTAI